MSEITVDTHFGPAKFLQRESSNITLYKMNNGSFGFLQPTSIVTSAPTTQIIKYSIVRFIVAENLVVIFLPNEKVELTFDFSEYSPVRFGDYLMAGIRLVGTTDDITFFAKKRYDTFYKKCVSLHTWQSELDHWCSKNEWDEYNPNRALYQAVYDWKYGTATCSVMFSVEQHPRTQSPTDQHATEQSSTDQNATEQASTEQHAEEQLPAEQHAAEQPPTEQHSE